MNYLPFGFHAGSGGNLTGIGKPDGYMPTLDAAGKPFGLISADNYGPVGEGASQYPAVDDFLLFRNTKIHEVPVYGGNSEAAALTAWQEVRASLPPEFDKEKVWIVIWNEPRKEKEWGDWMGETAYHLAQLTMADGYKSAYFGYSSGTPDADVWYTPGMVKFLKLAAQNPDKLAVALHEYSFTVDDILDGYPYKVGRFEFLHDACDDQNIGRPTIFITEFGWEYQDIPEVDVAMADIEKVANIYAVYDNIKIALIWGLMGGYGDIHNQTQKLIKPVTNLALDYVPPDPEPEPPKPPTETFEQYFWNKSIEHQCVSMNAESALQAAMVADGLTPVGTEVWDSYAEIAYAYRGAEDTTGVIPRRTYIVEVPLDGEPWNVFWFDKPDDTVVVPPVFQLTHWPANSYYVSQYYGARPNYYGKYCDANNLCLPGHNGWDIPIPIGGPFKCAVSGEVIWASNYRPSGGPSDYGWHVRVRTGGYVIIYAHMAASPPVAVGDKVVGGQVLGFSGNTGVSSGPHLHFEMRHCLTSKPEWPWCIIDPTLFLEPLRDNLPEPNNVDMLPYFQVVPFGVGPFYVFQHSNGVTENIQHQMENGEVLIVKNSQYERLRVTASHIERREDTSPGNNLFYMLDDGYGWSRWCPRFWRPGDKFFRSPDIRVFEKGSQKPCVLVKEDLGVGSWLRFENWLPTWKSPASDASPDGIVLAEVSHFSFAWTHDGPSLEDYWFAKGVGLTQWMNNSGAHSWISDLPSGRQPLDREVLNCL